MAGLQSRSFGVGMAMAWGVVIIMIQRRAMLLLGVLMLLLLLIIGIVSKPVSAQIPSGPEGIREQQCWVLLGGLHKRQVITHIDRGFPSQNIVATIYIGPVWYELSFEDQQVIDSAIQCVLVKGEVRRTRGIYRDWLTKKEVARTGEAGLSRTH